MKSQWPVRNSNCYSVRALKFHQGYQTISKVIHWQKPRCIYTCTHIYPCELWGQRAEATGKKRGTTNPSLRHMWCSVKHGCHEWGQSVMNKRQLGHYLSKRVRWPGLEALKFLENSFHFSEAFTEQGFSKGGCHGFDFQTCSEDSCCYQQTWAHLSPPPSLLWSHFSVESEWMPSTTPSVVV